ncbi:ABC transporter permease [Hymenobacter caeli]|uniref:ABC transport system permease protein n=1 Tax=Hymenobacter caeli TaxID=2735894 RepID=A0ABX2FQZ4_9BACT|nr:ABC transporter permease [Hymenobacter caeli]NRT19598.1 putative ABC transport system permease protein [Hymenobacter caeli]
MNLFNLLKITYRSLGKNKTRAFLTMLGIVIGVGAVIAMLAIGNGTRQNIQQQIAGLGTNVIIVTPDATNQGGVRQEVGGAVTLTQADADALPGAGPAVRYASPLVRATVQVLAAGHNWRTTAYGAYPSYFDIRDLALQAGTRFTTRDEQVAAKVCVVGPTVATALFGTTDVVGQQVRVGSIPFRIVGVLVAKGQSGAGQDQDDQLLAPFSTVQKRLLAGTSVRAILLSAQTEARIPEATAGISQRLRQRHRLAPGAPDDFAVHTQTDISNAAGSVTGALTVLLASIAGISLLVGGIGIMNIMLVSVTERTREIGIRLAIGATGTDVLLQFLLEAVVLSVAGGVLGIGLGWGLARVAAHALHWEITVSPSSVGLAFAFSSAIGVFFGWYPARKAAHMNPIDALHYE